MYVYAYVIRSFLSIGLTPQTFTNSKPTRFFFTYFDEKFEKHRPIHKVSDLFDQNYVFEIEFIGQKIGKIVKIFSFFNGFCFRAVP